MLLIRVIDFERRPVTDAKVTVLPTGPAQLGEQLASRTGRDGVFRLDGALPPGSYEISVVPETPGLLDKKQDVEIVDAKTTTRALVILGSTDPDQRSYRRGGILVPFQPRRDRIGIRFAPMKPAEQSALDLELLNLGFEIDPLLDLRVRTEEAVRLLSFQPDQMDRPADNLNELEGVELAGAVVEVQDAALGFLTDQAVVRFVPHADEEARAKAAKRNGFAIEAPIPFLPDAAVVRFQGSTADEPAERAKEERDLYLLLEYATRLEAEDAVAWVEPNLAQTAIEHALPPPADRYWLADDGGAHQGAWQLAKGQLQAEQAWSRLHDEDKSIAYGASSVRLAVLDLGVRSSSGEKAEAFHPELRGQLPDGSPKIPLFYDFKRMRKDNAHARRDGGPHGMEMTGLASARVNNDLHADGTAEGVVGVAPDCSVVSLIRPKGGTDLQYANVYFWLAGGTPGWQNDGVNYTTDESPDPIPPGVDVVLCSFGAFAPPLPSLVEAALTILATQGRGGKGTPIFCSAGNSSGEVGMKSGEAASSHTITVSAVVRSGARASMSNYGEEIDICAPTSDGDNLMLTTTFLGLGRLGGHVPDRTDDDHGYETTGGTSAANALAAGVAALVLSANPKLTADEVRQLLRTTADGAAQGIGGGLEGAAPGLDWGATGDPGFSLAFGFGRVNADAAVKKALELGENP